MVEVQGRAGGGHAADKPGRQHAKKGGGVVRGGRRLWLWRCGWRCFACTTTAIDCCCGGGGGGAGPGGGKRSGEAVVRTAKERALLWVGGVSLLLGVSLAAFWTQLLTLVVHGELQLSPRSTSFQVWRSTPVPLRIDFYFWNWTNPHEFEDPLAVPDFTQMGPYRFKETKEKVNITWHAGNGTVSFRQLRRWYFDAENSNGTLLDNVTTLNAVALTAAHVVRDWHFLMQRSVALALRSTNQQINITRTVGEFLFEGFEDPLVTIASKVPGLSGVDIPNFDKFGWFYMRNGSTDYDGHFNMDTGAGALGVAGLGELRRWNHRDRTPFYEGACGALRGSAGELFPPGRAAADRVSLFAPDICRSVSLERAGAMEEAGVAGLRFEGGPLTLDNGQLDAANGCFCGARGECVPGGVANVSACRYGAPAFVSFPHFHLADPAYRAAVRGMRPTAREHAFYIALEPTYGIPLDVAARFQINLLVRRNRDIYMLAKVPESTMFPVIWFEQRAAITAALALPLRLLLQLPVLLLVAAAAMVAAGLGCVLAAYLLRRHRHRLRADTLALVAEVVAKGATKDSGGGGGGLGGVPKGQQPPPPPLLAPLLDDSRSRHRRRLRDRPPADGSTGSPTGAGQPLLPLSPGSGSAASSSSTASSPAPYDDAVPVPEHSGTPEPEPEPAEPPTRSGSAAAEAKEVTPPEGQTATAGAASGEAVAESSGGGAGADDPGEGRQGPEGAPGPRGAC